MIGENSEVFPHFLPYPADGRDIPSLNIFPVLFLSLPRPNRSESVANRCGWASYIYFSLSGR